jgi:hypothetical protein
MGMTDEEAEALAAQIESSVPPSPESVHLSVAKPHHLELRGTAAGLRRLAAAILRSSVQEFAGPTEGREAWPGVLKHLTRTREPLDSLVHPGSGLRFLGVAAFRDLPRPRPAALSRARLGWLGCAALAVAASILGSALVLGLWRIVLWLRGS